MPRTKRTARIGQTAPATKRTVQIYSSNQTAPTNKPTAQKSKTRPRKKDKSTSKSFNRLPAPALQSIDTDSQRIFILTSGFVREIPKKTDCTYVLLRLIYSFYLLQQWYNAKIPKIDKMPQFNDLYHFFKQYPANTENPLPTNFVDEYKDGVLIKLRIFANGRKQSNIGWVVASINFKPIGKVNESVSMLVWVEIRFNECTVIKTMIKVPLKLTPKKRKKGITWYQNIVRNNKLANQNQASFGIYYSIIGKEIDGKLYHAISFPPLKQFRIDNEIQDMRRKQFIQWKLDMNELKKYTMERTISADAMFGTIYGPNFGKASVDWIVKIDPFSKQFKVTLVPRRYPPYVERMVVDISILLLLDFNIIKSSANKQISIKYDKVFQVCFQDCTFRQIRDQKSCTIIVEIENYGPLFYSK